MDLGDMTYLAAANDGYKFVLVSVDTLSKKAYVQPVLSKRGVAVTKALEKLWPSSEYPRFLRTDKGLEFTGHLTQAWLQAHNITHFVTQNEPKAHLAEKFLQFLKNKIQRYVTFKQNERYIDHLQDIIAAYNNREHASIGMSPNAVNSENARLIWWTQYWPEKRLKQRRFLFQVGDIVRVTYLRHAFVKGYDLNFSGEEFRISYRTKRAGIPIYKLIDMNKEVVIGTFYTEELTKTTPQDKYLVQKVLKTRKRRGHPAESLVRWLHHGSKFDSWIESATLENV
jgi:hypothetical protein